MPTSTINVVITLAIMALSGVTSAQDGRRWEASKDYEASKDSALVWYRVVWVIDRPEGREIASTYASYNHKESADKVAAEMNRMKLGPVWHIGLPAKQAIDIREHLSKFSADIKTPSIDEQRAWWKARAKQ